jgi:hypothetical protein
MQQIEITPKIKESTDRILAACEEKEAAIHSSERAKYLLCTLKQSLGRDLDSPALALHHLNKSTGVLSPDTESELRALLVQAINNEFELRKIRQQRKENNELRDLCMGICTAQYTNVPDGHTE